MPSYSKDVIRNIFHGDEKAEAEKQQQTLDLQNKTNSVFGRTANDITRQINPFLKKDGSLVNPHLNYQTLLNNPNISQTAKKYISQATGLSPTEKTTASPTPTSATPTKTSTTTTQSDVTPNNVVSEPTKTESTSIVDAAKKYMGTPYVWGGESMEEGGMDCSGFVYNALKDAGYNVGRTTAQGYRKLGQVVSKADMQAGDLIFYGDNDNASHIGIYIGNGQVIHSSGGSANTKDNPGKGVTISNVDYRSDFLEVRRY